MRKLGWFSFVIGVLTALSTQAAELSNEIQCAKSLSEAGASAPRVASGAAVFPVVDAEKKAFAVVSASGSGQVFDLPAPSTGDEVDPKHRVPYESPFTYEWEEVGKRRRIYTPWLMGESLGYHYGYKYEGTDSEPLFIELDYHFKGQVLEVTHAGTSKSDRAKLVSSEGYDPYDSVEKGAPYPEARKGLQQALSRSLASLRDSCFEKKSWSGMEACKPEKLAPALDGCGAVQSDEIKALVANLKKKL